MTTEDKSTEFSKPRSLTWDKYPLTKNTYSKPRRPISNDFNSKLIICEVDNIATFPASIIVNAANDYLGDGGGIAGAIFERAVEINALNKTGIPKSRITDVTKDDPKSRITEAAKDDINTQEGYFPTILGSRFFKGNLTLPVYPGTVARTNAYGASINGLEKLIKEEEEKKKGVNKTDTKQFHPITRRIYHAVGPKFVEAVGKDADALACCYKTCLDLCVDDIQKGILKQPSYIYPVSIAFPILSSGLYLYPLEDACKIAMESIRYWLDNSDESMTKLIDYIYVTVWSRERQKTEYLKHLIEYAQIFFPREEKK